MKTKIYILTLFLTFPLLLFSQSNYYYYDNQKVYINIDREYVSLNSISDFNFLTDYSANYISKTEFVENNVRSYVTPTDNNAQSRVNLKNYYSEIKVKNNVSNNILNYTNFINSLNQNSNTIKVSPCFKTLSGKRLGLTNNFYVKINSSSNVDALYNYAQINNLEVIGKDPYMSNWYILSCSKINSKNSLEYANQFHESGLFITAEPEFVYHDLQTTNDPHYNNQWGLKNTGQYGSAYTGIDINAEQVWSVTRGDNVKVAIYDHGFEMNHPDLASNVFGNGFDASTGTSPSQVRGSHGTACAGIIGAIQDNNIGISGVAPESDIISISINLQFSDTPAQLASGFNWAWQNGVEIISNSWGGYAPSTIITDAIYNAINNGRNGLGCIIVFASGNENNTNIRYPGSAVPEVLVVGAMSPCGERKSPSSCDGESWGGCYGNQLDIVAPGVKIPTTDRQGGLGYSSSDYHSVFNGTSSACPHVAGVAALILSVNPNLTAEEVNNIIERTAQKIGTYNYTNTSGRPNGTWNNEMGYGLVDAYAAVQMAQQTACTEKPQITLELEPIGSNYVAVHMVGANGTDINSQCITSTTWQKISSSGGCYASFGGSGFDGLGHGNCNSWSVYAKITATNSNGTTTIYRTITPPAPAPCDEPYRIERTAGYHTYRIIDPCRSSGAFSLSNNLNSRSIEKQEVRVFNHYGTLIFISNEIEFDLSFLRKGIYFIKAYVNEEIITHKIIR